MGERRGAHVVVVEKLHERHHPEDLRFDGRIILK
jgi:hypothetical protein